MPLDRREFNYGLALSLVLLPFHRSTTQQELRIDLQRLLGHVRTFGSFGKDPQGAVSRMAYSDADKYVQMLMKNARLYVTIDAAR